MKSTIVFLLLLITACSSSPKINPDFPTDSELADKVINRIDNLNSRPTWFKESESFKVLNGNVISLGSAVIPGDHRIDAAIRIAQSNAKAGFCSAIEQRLEFIFQNAQEGTEMNSNLARYIGAEACNLTTSSMRIAQTYWEKVSSIRDSGERFTQYKVFATVVMSEADLKLAILSAAAKRAGKGGLSKDFAQKVDQQWDQFTKGDTLENSKTTADL